MTAGVTLRLYTYNEWTNYSGLSFRGDTNLVIPNPRLSAMTYGWCMRNPLVDPGNA